VEAKGGNAEGLMSPVYALMKCVDSTLIGQQQGGDGGGEVQTTLT